MSSNYLFFQYKLQVRTFQIPLYLDPHCLWSLPSAFPNFRRSHPWDVLSCTFSKCRVTVSPEVLVSIASGLSVNTPDCSRKHRDLHSLTYHISRPKDRRVFLFRQAVWLLVKKHGQSVAGMICPVSIGKSSGSSLFVGCCELSQFSSTAGSWSWISSMLRNLNSSADCTDPRYLSSL